MASILTIALFPSLSHVTSLLFSTSLSSNICGHECIPLAGRVLYRLLFQTDRCDTTELLCLLFTWPAINNSSYSSDIGFPVSKGDTDNVLCWLHPCLRTHTHTSARLIHTGARKCKAHVTDVHTQIHITCAGAHTHIQLHTRIQELAQYLCIQDNKKRDVCHEPSS